MINTCRLFLILCLYLSFEGNAQLYFPPNGSATWETTNPSEYGWCQERIDAMYDFLESTNSKGFIVLIDGKIVLEKYFGTFTVDSMWYWASAGKTLTSLLTGIAQEEGYLDIDQSTSSIIGGSWTSCTAAEANAITVRHHLTMTTGFDENVPNNDCTDPSCLQCLAAPGTRWSYHNAPYTRLDTILSVATGQNFNQYFNSRIRNKIGMDGFWFSYGYNNVYFSRTRSLARFGLCIQNNAVWNTDTLLHDQQFLFDMHNTSQDINLSYGYLWWLNGKSSFMLPQSQFVFPGSLCPDAPNDMFAAMGKNGQLINIVPSLNMVVVRVGNLPTEGIFVPNFYNNDIWEYINNLTCTNITEETEHTYSIYPNPTNGSFMISGVNAQDVVTITDAWGRTVPFQRNGQQLNLTSPSSGWYAVRINGTFAQKILVN